ncbi:MAG TPA: hypothetical protein VHY08_13460 [Bacillota bacterium]|nr:hypothetical protein [Bacillota bacterium]
MQIKIFGRLSLWKKFAATLVLYGFLLLIVTLSISYFTNTLRITSETKQKGESMLELAVLATADPLWNYNSPAAIANGEALLKDNETCLVEIKESSGKVVYQKVKRHYAYPEYDNVGKECSQRR